jgi:hypothetical protein
VSVQIGVLYSTTLAIRNDGKCKYELPYVQHKDYQNADCARTIEEKCEDGERFESELISIAKFALWERGASNACDRYWDVRK